MPSALTDILPERLSANPLGTMRSDSDIEAVADTIASAAFPDGDNERFFKTCGRHLLSACLGYLRDWCEPEQRTFANLAVLLKGAVPAGKNSGSRTDLGDLFYEIESGCRRTADAGGWEPTGLVRNDGTSPCDTNGIRPEDDFSLGCYRRFARSASPSTRVSVALALLTALPQGKGAGHGE